MSSCGPISFSSHKNNYNLLPHELIVDNFAGGGGTSTGLEQAFNLPVDIVINHDPKALAMHRINHPNTVHYCESVWDVDPIKVTNNQPVGLVWLSPDCKHFSRAKGGKPVEKKIRGLAWVALRWAAKTRPRIIMLENVEEFKTWGDIGPNGRPCPKRIGRTFKSFVNALKRQGYDVEWRELRACDYGSPTIRKRFFLIARRDGLQIQWPEKTHGKPSSPEVKRGLLKPWISAAECMDWSIACPSIFNRKRPLVDATLHRIYKGLTKFVIQNETPYILNSTAPVLTECANASSKRSMPITEPLRTICSQTKGGHHAVMVSHLSKMKKNSIGQDLYEPIHAMTTVNQFAEVRAYLAKYHEIENPGTTPWFDQFGVITIDGEKYIIVDIGFRMVQPNELYKAQGFPSTYIFTHGIDECGTKISLTKTEQTRMVGNSVCPQLARALVEANFKHELVYTTAA